MKPVNITPSFSKREKVVGASTPSGYWVARPHAKQMIRAVLSKQISCFQLGDICLITSVFAKRPLLSLNISYSMLFVRCND
jgi:hypothetical protein